MHGMQYTGYGTYTGILSRVDISKLYSSKTETHAALAVTFYLLLAFEEVD